MKPPASYAGTAVVPGKVAAMAARLDPQRWSRAFPDIWKKSYYAQDIYFVQPPKRRKGRQRRPAKALGVLSSYGALQSRAAVPPPLRATLQTARQAVRAPGVPPAPKPSLRPPRGTNPFYEDVFFGGYRYRNLLHVTYRSGANGASYQYSQHGCLNIQRDPTDIDGGIDVDCGSAVVKAKGKSKIEVTLIKKVRLTEPGNLSSDLNDLAHLFIPLSLDSWLHNLIFTT
jgi:hypothetical protein